MLKVLEKEGRIQNAKVLVFDGNEIVCLSNFIVYF